MFEEVLKKQEKGEFGGLWEKIDECEKRLLPAESKSTKQLNQCLEKLYSTELKPDFDVLEMVVNNGSDAIAACAVSRLDELFQKISESARTAEEFLSHGYENKSALRKVAQIAATARLFDQALAYLADWTGEQFSKAYVQIKGWAELANIAKVCETRVVLGNLTRQFEKVNAVCKKRKIERKMPEAMERLARNAPQIDEIENEIGLLVEKLDSISLDDESYRQRLNKIYSDNFKGIFRKTLLDKCRNAEYYEGKILAEYLKQQMDYLISNFGKIRKTWQGLCQDIDDLKKLAEHPDFENLEMLKKLKKGFDLQKYDSCAGLVLTSFSKAVQEYTELARQFHDRLYERIKERDENERQLQEAKAKAEQEAKAKAKLEKRLEQEQKQNRLIVENSKKVIAETLARAEKKENSFYKSIAAKLDDLDGLVKKKDSQAYGDLSRQLVELKEQLSEYKSQQGEAKAAAGKKIERKVSELAERFSELNERIEWLLAEEKARERRNNPAPAQPQPMPVPQVIIQYVPQPASPQEPERKACEPGYDFVRAVQELCPSSTELYLIKNEIVNGRNAVGLVDRVLEAGRMFQNIKPKASRVDYHFVKGLRNALEEAMRKEGEFKKLADCYDCDDVYRIIEVVDDYLKKAECVLRTKEACLK